jgi:integrase
MDKHQVGLLVDEYLEWAETRRGLRPLTLRMYKNTLGRFVRHIGDTPLEDLTPEDVEEFAGLPLRNGQRPAGATVRRDTVAVRQFMKWCNARKRIACFAHLTVVAPTAKAGRPKPVPDELWKRLWESDTLCPDDRLWLGQMYFCGMRRFEVVTIRPEAIDPATQTMTFERKGGSYDAVDYLAMPASVAAAIPWVTEGWEQWVQLLELHATVRRGEPRLCVYATAEDPFLDGNRLTKRMYQVLESANLPRNSFTPHQLRHSCATNLFRAGWGPEEVQKAMSHSSFEVTKGYMDVSGHMRAKLRKAGVL